MSTTERVVDDEAPSSIWLLTQHVRGLGRHLYSFTVGSCTRKGPIGERKGQSACFKNLPDLQSERWLGSKEALQGCTDLIGPRALGSRTRASRSLYLKDGRLLLVHELRGVDAESFG